MQREFISVKLVNARNPNAIVMSKIKALKKDGHPRDFEEDRSRGGGGEYGGGGGRRESSRGEVEAYLERHAIDHTASAAFLELPPDLQRQIMEKDLSNCRNASAVLLSRVKSIRSAA